MWTVKSTSKSQAVLENDAASLIIFKRGDATHVSLQGSFLSQTDKCADLSVIIPKSGMVSWSLTGFAGQRFFLCPQCRWEAMEYAAALAACSEKWDITPFCGFDWHISTILFLVWADLAELAAQEKASYEVDWSGGSNQIHLYE